jgi:hypothetical protein
MIKDILVFLIFMLKFLFLSSVSSASPKYIYTSSWDQKIKDVNYVIYKKKYYTYIDIENLNQNLRFRNYIIETYKYKSKFEIKTLSCDKKSLANKFLVEKIFFKTNNFNKNQMKFSSLDYDCLKLNFDRYHYFYGLLNHPINNYTYKPPTYEKTKKILECTAIAFDNNKSDILTSRSIYSKCIKER